MIGAKSRRGLMFYGYLGVLFSLLIISAVAVWLIYAYLPYQYYLVGSFSTAAAIILVAYAILSRRVMV